MKKKKTKPGEVIRQLQVGDGAVIPIPPTPDKRRLMRERLRRIVYSIAGYYGRKFQTQCHDSGMTIRRVE